MPHTDRARPAATPGALQCDDKLLRIYRTSTWGDPELVDKPYRRAITTTFATRLSFPPDGSFLLTGNASQRGNHTAVVLPRGKWADPKAVFYLAGHTGGWAGGAGWLVGGWVGRLGRSP